VIARVPFPVESISIHNLDVIASVSRLLNRTPIDSPGNRRPVPACASPPRIPYGAEKEANEDVNDQAAHDLDKGSSSEGRRRLARRITRCCIRRDYGTVSSLLPLPFLTQPEASAGTAHAAAAGALRAIKDGRSRRAGRASFQVSPSRAASAGWRERSDSRHGRSRRRPVLSASSMVSATAVPELLYPGATIAKWLLPQEKATSHDPRTWVHELWNRSKTAPISRWYRHE